MNKIIVDGRFFNKNPAGVARYILNILINFDEKIKIELISNKKIFLPTELQTRLNLKVMEYRCFRFLPGTFFNMFIVPFLIKLKENEFYWGGCHSVPLGMKNTVLTVHDLIAFKFGKTMTFSNRLINIIALKMSLKSAAYIHSVSEITKRDLIYNFKGLNNKIYIVRNSVDANIFNKFGVKKNGHYLLAVGTLEPRKNLEALVMAYFKLRKSNNYSGKLVIIGLKGWKNNFLFELINGSIYYKDIIIPGYICDVELAEYYRGTDLFVFPSLYEGFGIPPLEAYNCGVKVVTSVYTEIANMNLKNVFIFDPQKDDLVYIMINALNFDKIDQIEKVNSWKEEAGEFCKSLINCE